MRVSIVVLGDLGRSPRMVYHALALAARGVSVDLIGYEGSLPRAVIGEPHITCHVLGGSVTRGPESAASEPRHPWRAHVTWLAQAASRTLRLCWHLPVVLLIRTPRPDVVLVQSPPAVPVLAIAWLSARLRAARFIIDWHNRGSSLVALRLHPGHPVVRLVDGWERFWGRRSDGGLCVSAALQVHLTECGLCRVHVFRDRPAARFRLLSADERAPVQTRVLGAVCDRLVVVPSSWSPDDDFDLLLAALSHFAQRADDCMQTGAPVPPVTVVLTGDGPLRARYEARFDALRSDHLRVLVRWFSPDDYAALLGTADLGISVHRSASGLDLPMKVCDLLGAAVPVCALDYGPCLAELARADGGSLLFQTAEELAARLAGLLGDDEQSRARLDYLRAGAAAASGQRWEDGWAQEAWPLLRGASL